MVWVIGSKNKLFRSARIKLTLFYFSVTAIIILLFSLAFYFTLSAHYGENFKHEKKIESQQQKEVDKTIKSFQAPTFQATNLRLIKYILLIDTFFLFFATIISYFLSQITLRPIEKALDLQKQFSANASHELRTPLAIVKTDFEVALRNNRLNINDYQAIIKSNLEEIDRMSNIVQNILKLSRNDHENKNTFHSIFKLDQLILRIAKKMNILAKNKKIDLKIQQLDQVFFTGNTFDFEDILINLLQNAINYTKPGGIIEIQLAKKINIIELSISDTGIGINSKDLPHILERFYKVDQARVQTANGAGIGLSLVSELVKKYSGKISITSELKKGTKIIIRFAMQ
jgi:signal transduction histidine kinase